MTEHNSKALKEKARTKARDILSRSASFQGLEKAEQFSIYKDIVDSEYQKLAKANGSAKKMSGQMASNRAGDYIDERRHGLPIDEINAGLDAGTDFIDDVDFPQFVKELLKSVFDANLEVTREQMEDYQSLLRSATRSVASFVKDISKEDSFGYLAENNDEFGLSFAENDETQEQELILIDKDGDAVDTEDTRIAGLITEAQVAMAKERRAMLREMILMGVSRLVIDKGTVKAKVKFNIGSKSKTIAKDSATTKGSKIRNSKGAYWGWRRGFGIHKTRRKQSNLSIARSTSTQDTSIEAEMMGEVEINFKSDYFKLDNFAELYKTADKEEKQTPA